MALLQGVRAAASAFSARSLGVVCAASDASWSPRTAFRTSQVTIGKATPSSLMQSSTRRLLTTSSSSALHGTQPARASLASSSLPSSEPNVDIQELANKARLRLSDEEASEFQESVSRIVDWFGQLQAADVEGVEPAVHAAVFGESGVESLRKDEPVTFEKREEMLSEVPEKEGPYLKVPKILGGIVDE